jgi:predicted ATPase
MTARVSSPLFVGRAGELDQLARAMARAASGTPSIILVGGEAGIGKSRLVAEAVASAAGRESFVLRGSCVDLGGDDGLPFAPIAEALRELVRRLDPEALAALGPGHARPRPADARARGGRRLDGPRDDDSR